VGGRMVRPHREGDEIALFPKVGGG
jgi:molybdopterin converting factor small subunit